MLDLSDAEKIAQIIRQADGGCSNCVAALVELANKTFPDFKFAMYETECVETEIDLAQEPVVDWYPIVKVTQA
jgi:glutamate formiminotransferase